MRCRRLTASVLLLLAGCASGGNGATPSEEPDRRDVATEWYLRSISSDGRTINVVYTMSGVASDCEREGRVFAEESTAKVVVAAHKSVTTDRNRACTEELGYVEGSARLEEPLGDRSLVGCRPGKVEPAEDRTCRDLERSREHGIFEFSPPPSPG